MLKREALKILNKEQKYEENLMKELTEYFLSSLNKIKDLSKQEIELLDKKISVIRDETIIHKEIFERMIKYVSESEDDNF